MDDNSEIRHQKKREKDPKVNEQSAEAMCQGKLWESLNYAIDLSIPGFRRSVPKGTIRQRAFAELDSEEWYRECVKIVVNSIGKEYLPIYRMADGEFSFCVGPIQESGDKDDESILKRIIRSVSNQYLPSIRRRSVKTCWGEQYSNDELQELMPYYADCVRNVANHGFLAIHFTLSEHKFAEQYHEPMCCWYEEVGIKLSPINYIPFYFVYALLSGSDVLKLVGGRRILIISSIQEEKSNRVKDALRLLGAKHVDWIGISAERSLCEKISIGEEIRRAEVILVGGGIGSAAILSQLASVRTVCIDAGICIDCWARPELRDTRIFLRSDVSV